MGLKSETRVDCDACGKKGPASPDGESAVRGVIVRGWLVGCVFDVDLFLCESCKKDKPSWWPKSEEAWKDDDD